MVHYDVVPSSSVYIEMDCASPSVVLVLEAEISFLDYSMGLRENLLQCGIHFLRRTVGQPQGRELAGIRRSPSRRQWCQAPTQVSRIL